MSLSVKEWMEALKDECFAGRCTAARILGELGAVEAVPALTAALQDREAGVRDEAARALGALGPAASVALPALRATLEDANGFVRRAAAEALEKILQKEEVPAGAAVTG